jgi:hypothetical protein
MAVKKASPSRPKATKPRASQPVMQKPGLKNLAARPTTFGDESTFDDSMLADTSGVFRVTSALRGRQANDDADRYDRPIDPPPAITEDIPLDDEAVLALKRERLRALASRDAARRAKSR